VQPAWIILLKAIGCVLLIMAIPYTILTLYAAYKAKTEELQMLQYEMSLSNEPTVVYPSLINLYDYNGTLKLTINSDTLYYMESQDNYVKIFYENHGKLLSYMLRCRTKTIEENLALAYTRKASRSFFAVNRRDNAYFRDLLATMDMGLEDRMKTKMGLLSGGQRQALTLLMATLQKPLLLLLDEHTAALDPKTAEKVLELSDRIVEESHLTTMMVTHNMKDAIAHGNRLIMMYDGRIVVDVSGEEKKKLTVPQLLELFGKASGSDEADDKLLLS